MSTLTVVSFPNDGSGKSEKKMWTNADEEANRGAEQTKQPPSIRELMETFAGETSMHGVKNAAYGKRHLFHKMLWGVLVLAMAVWLAYTAADLYSKYHSYPYTTFIDISRRTVFPFPAVTICLQGFNIDRNYLDKLNNSQMMKEYLLRLSDLRHYVSVSWTSDDLNNAFGNASFHDIFSNGSLNTDDVFVFGIIGSQRINFKADLTATQVDNSECFSYNVMENRGDLNGQTREKTVRSSEYLRLFMRIDESRLLPSVSNGVAVYIHNPNEPVSPNDTPVNIPSNSSATIYLDPVEYHFLSEPYLSFAGKKCVDTQAPNYQSPLAFNLSYTWRNCITEASIKYATNTCKCSIGWTKDYFDFPVCTLAQQKYCYTPSKNSETSELLYGSKTDQCLSPCSFREYQHKLALTTPYPTDDFKDYAMRVFPSSLPDNTFDGYISLTVGYERSLVTVMKHTPAMSVEDIYSTLGGQMGFFLGASLLTMTELLEAVVFLLWTILATKTKDFIECCKAKTKTTTRVTAFTT